MDNYSIKNLYFSICTRPAKKILPDGSIVHDVNASGNYDAAKIVKDQAMADTRKIWTTLPSRDYVTSNYNNFTVGNSAEINSLFGELGGRVSDYHSSTSECGTDEKGNSLPAAKLTELGIEDGNSDESVEGGEGKVLYVWFDAPIGWRVQTFFWGERGSLHF